MLIKSINVSGNFSYLWLKYVNDVDLSHHCAKSLLGYYSKKVSNKTQAIYNMKLDEHEYKVMYLCGVSKPYRHNKNFHLAFTYKKGNTLTYSNNGIDIVIENAIALPIDPKYINSNLAQASNRQYSTCRNWQFANWFNINHDTLELHQ